MRFTSFQQLDDAVIERRFDLDDVPGILWTPTAADGPTPLVLVGHPGGTEIMYPRVLERARRAIASGFAAATLELPGAGDRPEIPELQTARGRLRDTISEGAPVPDEIVDQLVLPLVDRAAPEWSGLIDAMLDQPEIGGPVGYSGGVISLGVRLAATEPRIAAAGLFAGSMIPREILAEARRVTIPTHVLLQWDEEFNPREAALALFDALDSSEKTLQANLGGHRGVPPWAGEDAARFFERHLR